MAKPVSAQTPSLPPIPTPAVPQFTLKLADHSYDIPAFTTTYTDPYTGKVTTTTTRSQHIQNKTIDITIRNQPFPSKIGNYTANLSYHIEFKGHFTQYYSGDPNSMLNVPQSNSEYTVTSIPEPSLPDGGQLDIRIQADLTYNYYDYEHIVPMLETALASSDFSTQTITIPAASTSSTNPTPYSTPAVPELSWLVIVPLLLSVFFVAVILRHRKTAILKQ
jgi:hypothetical protein